MADVGVAPQISPPPRTEKRSHWTAQEAKGLLCAIAISLFFAAMGLRASWWAEPVFQDATRHALNGALIHDMIRDGGWQDPVGYARGYYSHIPGTSIPYHPPLFPVFESLVYSVAGVSYQSARFAVAITVLIGFLAFYELVRRLSGSVLVGLAAAVAFFSLKSSLWLASEVMLEFPSFMLIALASLALYQGLSNGPPFRGLLAFGILTAAAIWTKQHSLFAVVLPLVGLLDRRRWELLRAWRFWLSMAVPWAAFYALQSLAQMASAASNKGWTRSKPQSVFWHHVGFYAEVLRDDFGLFGALLLGAAIAWYLYRRLVDGALQNLDILALWAVSATGLTLLLPPYENRYLFYVYPALAGIFFTSLRDVFSAAKLPRYAWAVPAAALTLLLAWHDWRGPSAMSGFRQAAGFVASQSPRRILLCSWRNGAFLYEYRVATGRLPGAYVMRGESFEPAFFEPAALSEFLHRMGVDYVVVEDTPDREPYETITEQRIPNLRLKQMIPLSVERTRPGEIRVYHHTNPSPVPEKSFHAISGISGGGRTIELK